MEIGLIWLMVFGAIGIGYFLGYWHNVPQMAVREAMLEQRIERMAREGMGVDQASAQASWQQYNAMRNERRF